MENENEEVIDSTTDEVETTETETTETETKKETLEEREARLERMLKQTRKKLGKDSQDDQSKKEVSTQNINNLDYGQKAFLIANGIKGKDEMDFVAKMVKETGKDLETLLESTFFKAEFEDFKEIKSTKEAIPKSSKRGANPSSDSVEYWIQKGELPADRELRTKVVNEKIAREKSKNVFYK